VNPIPEKVREALKPSLEGREKNQAAEKAVPLLYPEVRESLVTRRGEWTIAVRPDAHGDFSGGFCAVYRRDRNPKCFITGKTTDSAGIQRLLKRLTGKVVEQRWFFSWPPKNLNSGNGFEYGFKWGFRMILVVAVFAVLDLFLLPHYAEAVSQGLIAPFLGGQGSGGEAVPYVSLVRRMIRAVFPEKYLYLSQSVYTIAAFFVVPVFLITMAGEIIGRRSDDFRMRGVMPDAEGCLFGIEAREELERMHRKYLEDVKLETIFEQLVARGLKASREELKAILEGTAGIPDRDFPSGA